ncbi:MULTISPECIES: AI-2E family transporter [unclassified Lysinibacillus]|uniref:AI-2E family transporter n=1 Tax=unclassified Lysinibacillus TaxID=2636778 RepID=UPI0020116CEF|nr:MULTISPECIES: AI-2E family transporter [unclassified Lysinibacillus]MCL1698172.1 AI-2E family transporter [Lysinibacillus sp. BPa_S21]MCL1702544.1 AI-2E family transporter [Lysinibacillus sp. Bpr_S20]
MEKERPRERSNFFSTKFIRFLGGKNLFFTLIILLLLACVIFMFQKVSFIFTPLKVLFEVVILPGVLASIGYYLLRPIVGLFERWRISRVWGIFLLYIILIGIITLLVVLVYPFLRDQFTNLAQEFPGYFMALTQNIADYLNNSRFNEYLDKINLNYDAMVKNFTTDIVETVKNTAANLAQGVASGITGFVSTLTGIVLSLVTVPFILFYLLKDGEKLPSFILKMCPPRMRKEVHEIFHDMDKQISSYIQGQILVSMCIGAMVTIGFLIIGMKYALLLGFLAMITSVVPYLGPVIAITPAVIIALVTSPFMLIKLAIVWTVVQLIEGKFISPQIMGKSLSIHPITIIFVLLTAGSLFGVPGVILGIPGYAIIKVLVTHLFKLFKQRYNRYEDESHQKYDV